jgi:hypothetical protein
LGEKVSKVARKKRKPRARPGKWQEKFLKAFRETGIIGSACDRAGVERQAVIRHRKRSKVFQDQFEQAAEQAADRLEEEARRRAHDGLLRKKFTKGGAPISDPETGQQYAEREYSDTLLIFLLKGLRPGKFRDNVKHEHTGKDGAPLIPFKVYAGVKPEDV